VPLAAGGLDYGAAADAASNHLSAHNLARWNMEKVAPAMLTPESAAQIARRVLAQRLQAVHRALPAREPLRIGLFIRREPPFTPGTALAMDWTGRFDDKEAPGEVWRDLLLPALADVASTIRQHAPGREVECFGLPTLPAAMALGCAFLSTGGIGLSWRQVTKARPDQLWSLSAPRVTSGFHQRIISDEASARDIAVLVSVADNVEPLFASTRKSLPPLRAVAHVARSGSCPHLIDSAGEASDIAFIVQDAMRQARRTYGNIGTVHVFTAAPAGLAVLIGQLFNTFGAVQTYEHVGTDGSGAYRPAALLRPCE
jgi:hypothetical protein